MTQQNDKLVVRSHVARDLLQTATQFKNDRSVVWEYVVNGLQYVDPGVNPKVNVLIEHGKKRISIADNGRGMDWAGLQNFFVMHGENQDRLGGRSGRGKFGTGKSAAFGIGSILRITSFCGGKESAVELHRTEVEAMTSGEVIPVRILHRNIDTEKANGTVITIEEIHLRSIDQKGIASYIERHLKRWPKGVSVFVNGRECEVIDPPISFERRFAPDDGLGRVLGSVELVVRVSKVALDQDERGIAIYSKGVWHETTLAGHEGRELTQYLFGEIDVPLLDDDQSPIAPFDASRSMRLNPSNDTVSSLYAFVSHGIEAVRKELLELDRRRRADEESRRLDEQANEIARVINDDFDGFRGKLVKVHGKGVGRFDIGRTLPTKDPAGVEALPGTDIPAEVDSPSGAPGASGGTSGGGDIPRLLAPTVKQSPDGDNIGQAASERTSKKRSTGGFGVRFDHMGSELNRAKYVSDERTIYLNLDHPQFATALRGSSIDDISFRRLAYEVAFSEYSLALALELAQREGYYSDPTDPIVEILETINRLARKAAFLYSNDRNT